MHQPAQTTERRGIRRRTEFDILLMLSVLCFSVINENYEKDGKTNTAASKTNKYESTMDQELYFLFSLFLRVSAIVWQSRYFQIVTHTIRISDIPEMLCVTRRQTIKSIFAKLHADT